MLKIKKKRLENYLGNSFLAPYTISLRSPFLRRRTAKLRAVFEKIHQQPSPLFHQIQIETCSFCNNDCHFCPASTAADIRPKEFMSWDVINEITSQLKAIKFNGLISLFNNNDPLIDKRLPEIITHLKKNLPEAKIEIYTNGILLDIQQAVRLWNAGLDSLMVDHYYTNSARNRKVEKFIEDFKNSNYFETHSVTVNEINKEIVRSSRGGQALNKKESKASGFCAYPFMQFNVNYKGEIHLCCNDVYYQETYGNIMEKDLNSIWNSKKFQAKRKMLLEGNRNTGVCKNCDTFPVLKGSEEIVLQESNNQVVIPGYINNGQKLHLEKPAKVYPI
ncbi:MAG: radical SAM protein [Gammaproteobacteria bacterium]|nr:radical SAM protein [Gammaproteobacteria bacterium]